MSDLEPTRSRRIVFPPRAVPVNVLPETVESPFPDRRVIHWLPPDMAMTEGFSILITSEVLLHTSRHVARSLTHELGGFLLGNRYRCPNTGRDYIIIDQYVEAERTKSTEVSLTFTDESWARLEENLSGKFLGKKLLGWYHSHPTMSIFLSEDDLTLHRARFADPWAVALVLEPEKHIGGFFAWSNGKIDPNRYLNFYELLDGDSRESVVAWKNYHGVDPLHSATPVLGADNTRTAPGQPPAPAVARPNVSMALEPYLKRPGAPHTRSLWLRAAVVFVVAGLLTAAGIYALRERSSEIAVVNPPPTPAPTATREQPTPEPTPTPSPTPEQRTSQNNNGSPSRHNAPPPPRRPDRQPHRPQLSKEALESRRDFLNQKVLSDIENRKAGKAQGDPIWDKAERQRKNVEAELNRIEQLLSQYEQQ